MEMHINEFDTYFEELVHYHAGLGHGSTYGLNADQKSELMEAFEEHRDYFNLPSILGPVERILNSIDGYLLEAFNEHFAPPEEFLIPDVPCRTFNENNEHLLADNAERGEDFSDELRRMWV